MSEDYFNLLLQQLEQQAEKRSGQQHITLSIQQEDLFRLQALCELYAVSLDDLGPALFHTLLKEIEARMPYRPGPRVIREEDGDPIYEDIGPTPRYLEILRRLEKEMAESQEI
ncbi:MAG: hypothetical protein ACK4L8_15055 [Nitrincola lacisaponensis]|uniref:Uncharacterized protein n=1 Tax=Nitrincola lacisaponensis TaxID=267850 RepID=A0A063Y4S7_9GAMM|nr:hypothetical protein [Nitrincola lacisaponensis]KDE40679.1 hypothetical protein ADINL_1271 [Nitrincola lacisaponensis]